MPTLKFLDQKKEFLFDGELLEAFIASFPVRKRCSALAAALGRYGLSLPIPPEGVEKLLVAQRDEEWERGAHSARCQLLSDENFLGVLSEKQAQEILSSLDMGFLQALSGLAAVHLRGAPRFPPAFTEHKNPADGSYTGSEPCGVDKGFRHRP